MLTRRRLLSASLVLPSALAWAADSDAETALRTGGVVVALRHALAPGTFDPPGFRLGECSSQRNLSDEGRAQARRIGEWFRLRSLQPSRVRSSPWCRCLDTATLAFGSAQSWAALGSPRPPGDNGNTARLDELRQALALALLQRGRFEVWVTHMFILSALTGENTGSGEALILRSNDSGAASVLARLQIA